MEEEVLYQVRIQFTKPNLGTDQLKFNDVVGYEVEEPGTFSITRKHLGQYHLFPLANIQEIIIRESNKKLSGYGEPVQDERRGPVDIKQIYPCPKCRKWGAYYRKKKGSYRCSKCGHEWE